MSAPPIRHKQQDLTTPAATGETEAEIIPLEMAVFVMPIDLEALDSLSPSEKLVLVERLWDDLGDSADPIPLPEWVDQLATRRREETRDPTVGRSHEETWRRIGNR